MENKVTRARLKPQVPRRLQNVNKDPAFPSTSGHLNPFPNTQEKGAKRIKKEIALYSNKFVNWTTRCYMAKTLRPTKMSVTKKPIKFKILKTELAKELIFIKSMLSVLNIPLQSKGEDDSDYLITNNNKNENKEVPRRARNISELEEKLQKLKSQNNYNLKNKLVKKSLSSKLNKKLKKKERLNKNKQKPIVGAPFSNTGKTEKEEKPNVNIAKPVFNTDGKLVFSKFDFTNVGKSEKVQKVEKDPKKILVNLEEQKQKIRELEEKGDSKAKHLKEKIAWKTVLQKAEGAKVKDDPTLLKKSIKKLEQKKKQSKKKWDNRIQSVEQKKEDRQKKRKENISKKKKEKKSKVIKAATKRGRVVI